MNSIVVTGSNGTKPYIGAIQVFTHLLFPSLLATRVGALTDMTLDTSKTFAANARIMSAFNTNDWNLPQKWQKHV